MIFLAVCIISHLGLTAQHRVFDFIFIVGQINLESTDNSRRPIAGIACKWINISSWGIDQGIVW